jgi:hypothetical protein
LIAAFLVFILPACWSGALAQAFLESRTAPSSSNSNEEHEEREPEEELQAARRSVRPPRPTPAELTTAPQQKSATYQSSALLASVGPKAHPARLSVRRQQ